MKSKNQVKKCYYCRKTCHFIKDYFKKISYMKDRNNFDGSTAVMCRSGSDIQGNVLVSTTKRNPKEWVPDSDYIFHVFHKGMVY